MAQHALKKWLLRLLKFILFITLFVLIGKTLGNPYKWVPESLADKVSNLLCGYGNVGGEEIDNAYFYIDIITVFILTTAIYILTVKLINFTRSK